MKLCIVTNYNYVGYINENLIIQNIASLLGIKKEDTFDFLDLNSSFTVNKNYTHALIILNYKATSIQPYTEYLQELTIPKIFVVDTIPEKHREVNKEFVDNFIENGVESFTCLSKNLQSVLYEKYADGIIVLSELDKKLFKTYYPKASNKPIEVIPPSLGQSKDLKIKFDNFKPNSLCAFNGEPSYANGILAAGETVHRNKQLTCHIYGVHGRSDLNDEFLVNGILNTSPNVKFKGRLKNFDNFFKLYHIYLNSSIYDSFNYFTFLSLLNGMVPIVGSNTGTSSYFKSYPFISESTPESVEYFTNLILNTSEEQLRVILFNCMPFLEELSNEVVEKKYQTFLNEF